MTFMVSESVERTSLSVKRVNDPKRSSSSFSTIYLIAFVIMTTFFVIAFVGLKKLNDPKYDKVLAWQSPQR